ncbi:AbrB/MazE/SpoVT family DNA-binding domain-containing protein [Lactococcus kimchii]|uniref:AbrB/MazE/SpoVT family DNA-binding domain-containing protein n=1 Tax=Lactococcus sp. S-13 TaxID=2507158 RepID=UPI001022AF65|nr:AbrB/MazE/SpoVT family DNA-binding domain-containing protein [Lactococcus sp. S-13]RZI48314.1 DUF998 domain-containing protein [Lactococcus sp. S-13]
MSKIYLPKELYDRLQLKENEEIEVIDLAEDSFTLRKINTEKSDTAATWFIIPTLISVLIFFGFAFFFAHPDAIPLSGNQSLATAVITIANALGMLTFISAYFARRKTFYRQMTQRIYWRTFATVTVSVLLIVILATMGLFWFLGQIFYGVSFGLFTSTFLFAIFSGIINYVMIFVVDTFSINVMVNMLLVVSIGGFVSSMATNGNQYWWQRNFSLLGTQASDSSWQFNLTLIVSAALFAALVDYIFVSLRQKIGSHLRQNILQVLLTLCAVSIGLVGLIPNNSGWMHIAHDVVAQLIVLFMAISILGIRWFLPRAGRNLYRMSYLIVALILISYILWHPIHYLTLTAFEILSFSLCFAWLLLLVNTLINLLWNNRKIYQVGKEINEENLEKK